jgi:hypothetical protein
VSAAPSFDRSRAFYIGLNKVKDAYVAGTHTVPTKGFESKTRLKGSGAISPVGLVGGLVAGGSVESSLTSESLSDPGERSQLLAIAPQVFDELGSSSEEVGRTTRYEIGRAYHYTGGVRFRVRTHDDFRAEGEHESAPRLGLWLIEIPDSKPSETAESVTWVVLSGTAEGQLKTVLGGQVSDWRGGSQTEHLFELLAAKMKGKKRKDRDERWLRDPYYALAARNLLSDSSEQTVDVLFTCLDVRSCPVDGEKREVSYLGWSPASTDREVPVSKVILGTPYFVQMAPSAAANPVGEVRTLWQRFRDFFGL